MIFERNLYQFIHKEESAECNSISDISVNNVKDDANASCNDFDESSISSSICDGTSTQTDWRLLWWRNLDNFDEVFSFFFFKLN